MSNSTDLVKGNLDLGVFLEGHLPDAIEFVFKLEHALYPAQSYWQCETTWASISVLCLHTGIASSGYVNPISNTGIRVDKFLPLHVSSVELHTPLLYRGLDKTTYKK